MSNSYSLTGQSDLECARQLFCADLINYKQFQAISKRIAREEAKAKKTAELQANAQTVFAVINDQLAASQYVTVKTTANSQGIIGLVNLDRDEVAQALNALVSTGQLRKVGVVGGEEKDPSEVNAFQIRYARVEAAEEVEEA